MFLAHRNHDLGIFFDDGSRRRYACAGCPNIGASFDGQRLQVVLGPSLEGVQRAIDACR